MQTIRPAVKKDHPPILKILRKLDLYYSGLSLNNFWVIEKQGQVIGCVQLEPHENFQFLGSLAVEKGREGRGVGKKIMQEVLKDQSKDIYLYTIIPDFFKNFGFEITKTTPPDLPSKDRYECEYCHTEKCVCMVRKNDS